MRWLGALLAVLLAVSVANAQPAAPEAESGFPDIIGVLQLENEFFVLGDNTDRYYTQGLQLNALTSAVAAPIARRARHLPFMNKGAPIYRGGFVIGQNIYTPEDITVAVPNPRDRPYAGWLYLGGEVITYSEKELNTLQLQVGLVGPSAMGGWAQNSWHKHVNHIPEAQGWSHQLRDEVAFVIYGERRWRPKTLWAANPENPGGWAVDWTPHVDLALGTVQVSAAGGGILRLGAHLDDDFGPARIRPAPTGASFFGSNAPLSGYVFVGLDAKTVARDIFLDGNTFQDSPSVPRRFLVGELQAGLALRWCFLRLTHAYVWRSEEFLGQNGSSNFASVTIGFSTADLLSRRHGERR
jgi:hypothetical protein